VLEINEETLGRENMEEEQLLDCIEDGEEEFIRSIFNTRDELVEIWNASKAHGEELNYGIGGVIITLKHKVEPYPSVYFEKDQRVHYNKSGKDKKDKGDIEGW